MVADIFAQSPYHKKTETVVPRCSVKKVFIEISQNSQEDTCTRDTFLIKLPAQPATLLKKECLAQVFSCEFCEIYKKTLFYRTPPVSASEKTPHGLVKNFV